MGKPAKRATWTVVYRKEYTVWRAALSREQYELLHALFEGRVLGEALETVAASPGIAPAARSAGVHHQGGNRGH